MRYISIVFFLVLNLCAYGQERLDSILKIEEIQLRAIHIDEFSVGHQLTELNEEAFFSIKQNTLGTALNQESSLAIRQYGNGNIASISYKGLSPQHFGLFFEGIPLNSSFIGQFDYNNISSNQFNEVALRSGGSSSIGGGSTMGGSLHVENQLDFKKNVGLTAIQQLGSFGWLSTDVSARWSNNNWSTQLSFQHASLKNNYPFETPSGSEEVRENAALKRAGGMLQIQRKIKNNQDVKFTYWTNNHGYRDYPGTYESNLDSRLKNPIHLGSLLYRYRVNKSMHTAQLAYLTEDYTYWIDRKQSETRTQSVSKNKIFRYEWMHDFSSHVKIRSGILIQDIKGEGENYNDAQRTDYQLFVSSVYHQSNWKVGLNLNQGFSSDFNIPLVLDFGMEWNFLKNHLWKANFTTNFRSPTLNDLYFIPGGNPDLLPEEGWMAEMGYDWWFPEMNNSRLGFNVFYGKFNNFIEWLPNSAGIFSPTNQNEVENHGAEFQFKLFHEWNQWKFKLATNYAYTISRLNELDTQRRYVPRHRTSASLNVFFQSFGITMDGQYTSQTPIRNNDTRFLDAFFLQDIHLSYEQTLKHFDALLFFSIRNIWNTSYETYAAHPMPGINYNLTLKINYK